MRLIFLSNRKFFDKWLFIIKKRFFIFSFTFIFANSFSNDLFKLAFFF